jgi:hypothetical protein
MRPPSSHASRSLTASLRRPQGARDREHPHGGGVAEQAREHEDVPGARPRGHGRGPPHRALGRRQGALSGRAARQAGFGRLIRHQIAIGA